MNWVDGSLISVGYIWVIEMSETTTRKNLKIHEDTYEKLIQYKRRGESWDLYFDRMVKSADMDDY